MSAESILAVAAGPPVNPRMSFVQDARRIAPLAWPVFVGQVAVLAFATVDTVLVGRFAALDLAALAIGGAVYMIVFIGLMGTVLAVGPIAGQQFGAKRMAEAGAQLNQAIWLALGLSVLGSTLLLFPQPFLALARAEPAVALKVRAYLGALAVALPAALIFTAFRGFSVAVSRPLAVMALQLGALALKLPLTWLLIHGFALPAPLGEWRVPPLGVAGCSIATAIAMWGQCLAAALLLRRDRFYAPFGLHRRGLPRPDAASQRALLRLGVPMGLATGLEVTAFTSMSFFIARFGTTAVGGHQIAINLVSMMYMMPLALSIAAGTLVAQRLGAGDDRDARRLCWHSLELAIAIAALMGGGVFLAREALLGAYTRDAAIVAAALPLLAWLILFHIGDAAQSIAAFVLRAYRIATLPMLIYAASLWGVGMVGGYLLAFDVTGRTPAALRGAPGYWAAFTLGITLAALLLVGLLAWVLRTKRREQRAERSRALQ
ncbi:MAG: MATE family efflux transporter [Rhizobacter sp.]|nr:MATE family efflux transporter [Rhizobacter sp.]